MSDLADDSAALKEHNREVRERQRDKRTKQILSLAKEGFRVQRLTEYQYRINGCLDLYPTWAKWHDVRRNQRASFKGWDAGHFVRTFFGSVENAMTKAPR